MGTGQISITIGDIIPWDKIGGPEVDTALICWSLVRAAQIKAIRTPGVKGTLPIVLCGLNVSEVLVGQPSSV